MSVMICIRKTALVHTEAQTMLSECTEYFDGQEEANKYRYFYFAEYYCSISMSLKKQAYIFRARASKNETVCFCKLQHMYVQCISSLKTCIFYHSFTCSGWRVVVV